MAATKWYVTRKPNETTYVLYDFARSATQAKNMLRDLKEGSPIAHKSKSQGGLYNIYVKQGSPLWREKGGWASSKIANRDAASYVADRKPFRASNLDGRQIGKSYVVLSYGHYPIFVYKGGKWYENADKFSPSTAKQMGQVRPSGAKAIDINALNRITGQTSYGRGGEVEGTYGGSQTESTIYYYEERGGRWYVADGSVNVNFTYDPIEEGVDIETISDVDTFTASSPIESASELEDAVDDDEYGDGGGITYTPIDYVYIYEREDKMGDSSVFSLKSSERLKDKIRKTKSATILADSDNLFAYETKSGNAYKIIKTPLYKKGGYTQGYDDRQDESLGMRTGKESTKKQSDKARRENSYGKWGKRGKEDRKTSMAKGGSVGRKKESKTKYFTGALSFLNW